MWVSYPHMPTGANGTLELFQKLIAFGKKYNILIVNDNPYSFVLNGNPYLKKFRKNCNVYSNLNYISATSNVAERCFKMKDI